MPATGLNRYIPDWVVSSAPAVNTVATTTQAASPAPAGGQGTRHVCTSITAIFAAGTAAPTAAVGTVNLRDGASGAGTILASFSIGVEATAGRTTLLELTGLEIIGSPNTAMTLEFTAAGGLNTFESVTLTGHTL